VQWVDEFFWRLDGGTYLRAVLINEIPKLYLFCNLIGTSRRSEPSSYVFGSVTHINPSLIFFPF
jgi:hypothetical protein